MDGGQQRGGGEEVLEGEEGGETVVRMCKINTLIN